MPDLTLLKTDSRLQDCTTYYFLDDHLIVDGDLDITDLDKDLYVGGDIHVEGDIRSTEGVLYHSFRLITRGPTPQHTAREETEKSKPIQVKIRLIRENAIQDCDFNMRPTKKVRSTVGIENLEVTGTDRLGIPFKLEDTHTVIRNEGKLSVRIPPKNHEDNYGYNTYELPICS